MEVPRSSLEIGNFHIRGILFLFKCMKVALFEVNFGKFEVLKLFFSSKDLKFPLFLKISSTEKNERWKLPKCYYRSFILP